MKKKIAIAVVLAGVVAVVVAVVLARNRLVEEWYLHKLESPRQEEVEDAAARLAEIGSVDALPRILRIIGRTTEFMRPAVLRRRSAMQQQEALTFAAFPPGGPFPGAPGIPPDQPEEEEDGPEYDPFEVVEPSPDGSYSMLYGHDIMCYENAALCLAAVELVENAGERALPALVRMLKHDDGYVKYLAAALIGQLGEAGNPAWPILREIVLDEEIYPEADRPDFRAEASEALTAVLGEEVDRLLPTFIEMFCHWELPIKAAGMRGIEKAGDAALPHLVDRLKEGELEMRLFMLEAFARLGERSKPAVPAIVAALEHPDTEVKAAAIQALFHIGPAAADALPALERIRDDEDADEFLRDIAGQAADAVRAPATGLPPGGVPQPPPLGLPPKPPRDPVPPPGDG